jgi:hypothetical protein
MSVDPIFEMTRAPYAYTGDNPTNFADPSGVCGLSSFGDFGDCFDPTSNSNVAAKAVGGAETAFSGAAGDVAQFVIDHRGQLAEYGAVGVCIFAGPGFCAAATLAAFAVNTEQNYDSQCGFSLAREGVIGGTALLGALPGANLAVPEALGLTPDAGPAVQPSSLGPES